MFSETKLILRENSRDQIANLIRYFPFQIWPWVNCRIDLDASPELIDSGKVNVGARGYLSDYLSPPSFRTEVEERGTKGQLEEYWLFQSFLSHSDSPDGGHCTDFLTKENAFRSTMDIIGFLVASGYNLYVALLPRNSDHFLVPRCDDLGCYISFNDRSKFKDKKLGTEPILALKWHYPDWPAYLEIIEHYARICRGEQQLNLPLP